MLILHVSWHHGGSSRTDNKLERDFVDAVETYHLRSDGRIGVHFEWREKSFNAPVKTHYFTGSVVADGSNARCKMRLLPPFSASYLIVHVPPDYSVAAVAHPSRKFGRVLARERRISESQYGDLMQIFEKQGYDTSKFIRVPHSQAERLAVMIDAPDQRGARLWEQAPATPRSNCQPLAFRL